MKIKIILVLVLYCLAPVAMAADSTEVVPNTAETKAAINQFNEEIRKTTRRMREIEGGLALDGLLITGILPTEKGGFGVDMSTAPQNSIPFLSSTGVFGNIGIGTTGYTLTSNGASTPPSWQQHGKTVIASFIGKTDAVYPVNTGACSANAMDLSDNCSVVAGSSALGRGTNGGAVTDGINKYVFLSSPVSAADVVVYSSVWEKPSQVSTLYYQYTLWIGISGGGGGGRLGTGVVTVGSATSSTCNAQDVFANATTCSGSIDVSGLTNGQVYNVELVLTDEVQGGNQTTPAAADFIVYY